MSTTAQRPEASSPPDALDKTVVVSWKAPIVYGVITLLAVVLFVIARQDGDAVFRVSSPGEFLQLPEIVLGGVMTGAVCTVLLALITAGSVLLVRAHRRPPLWLAVIFALVFMIGFLTWAAAGATTSVIP